MRRPLFHLASLPYNVGVVPDEFLKNLEDTGKKRVHLIGIGGIGMSSLARWFLAQKWTVTGSDLYDSELIHDLRKEGVHFVLGHKKGLAGEAGIVVRSQAILPTNPEYREAAVKRIPIFTYPEMIGALTRRYDTIAVAGAHGKSTTTSMTALAAIAGKLDPTVILGTKLREFSGRNFRAGRSRWLVLEADEYGRAFLNYSPLAVIATNIDREHLDTYSGLADIKRTFLELFGRVREGGYLVLNEDNENLLSLRAKIELLAKKRRLRIFWFGARGGTAKKISASLKVPGLHNVLNALGAYTLLRKGLGLPEEIILKSLSAFKGSWRRAEHRGSYKLAAVQYEVYDDYAHHPTEIQATLGAFKEKFKDSALICVFQPHQAERLKKLFPEFKRSFDKTDVLVVFPEYRVAGREERPSPFTARAMALAIQKRNPKAAVAYVENPEFFSRDTVREALLRTGRSYRKAVIIMMGAGNIVEHTDDLLD